MNQYCVAIALGHQWLNGWRTGMWWEVRKGWGQKRNKLSPQVRAKKLEKRKSGSALGMDIDNNCLTWGSWNRKNEDRLPRQSPGGHWLPEIILAFPPSMDQARRYSLLTSLDDTFLPCRIPHFQYKNIFWWYYNYILFFTRNTTSVLMDVWSLELLFFPFFGKHIQLPPT